VRAQTTKGYSVAGQAAAAQGVVSKGVWKKIIPVYLRDPATWFRVGFWGLAGATG
jgi:hypothetical protein